MPGDNLQAMGFGALWPQGQSPNTLQKVTLQHISTDHCVNVHGYDTTPPITHDMFCAGDIFGQGTCFVRIHLWSIHALSFYVFRLKLKFPVAHSSHSCSKGDSGGPLIHIATNTQVGVVSWSKGNTCGSNQPSVYVRVSENYGFINGMMSTWAAGKAGKRPRNNGCTDLGGFYHRNTDMTAEYNCMWYAQSKHCQWYGNFFAHAGLTANNACCACGGGTRVNAKASKRI